jgi:UDP-N-acetyl-D-glucosamine dehydrogenase
VVPRFVQTALVDQPMGVYGDGATIMADFKTVILQRITTRQACVGIVGLGYVGLPLAVEFGRAGFHVIGVDVDPRKVEALNAGCSYIPDVKTEDVATLHAAGRLSATTDYGALRAADAVSICVPTPLLKTRDPDMSYIIAAAEQAAKVAHPGFLVVLESTTYPGTTEEILQPALMAKGFAVGQDVFLAFSPERTDPGNAHYGVRNTPKVIGGATPACTQVASAFYATVVDKVVPVSSMRAAEMVKLLENTFRAVNIGLANEMALMCDKLDVDVWEVIEAASTKPYGFMKFTPGPGLGGHCIPIDPLYLSWKLKLLNYSARFIEIADQINMGMPHHVVGLIQNALNEDGKPLKGSTVLVLGVAYKKDVGDLRESPALDVMATLTARQAQVCYHDPYVPTLRLNGGTLLCMPLSLETLEEADCVVVITNHSVFDWEMIAQHARLIVDTRNALDGVRNGQARVVKL